MKKFMLGLAGALISGISVVYDRKITNNLSVQYNLLGGMIMVISTMVNDWGCSGVLRGSI